jgi:hypothetical protein
MVVLASCSGSTTNPLAPFFALAPPPPPPPPPSPTTFFLDKTNLTSAITTQFFSCSCVNIGFTAKSIKRRVAQL